MSDVLRNLIKVIYPKETDNKSYSVFTDSQIEMLNQLIEYADYYDNKAFKYIAEKYPEYDSNANRQYTPAQIPINYSRYIVDKLASWQFEDSVDISVTTTKKSMEKKAKSVEDDLYAFHKDNNLNLKWLQAAKEANTSGGVAAKLIYDKDKGVRLLVRPRIECFPIPEFDDYEKINKVHFAAFKSEDLIWKQTYELTGGKCYFEEAIYNVKNNLAVEEVIQERTALGNGNKTLDFIPVYIIPNNPTIGMVWGYSELADLIPLINEIDKKYADASDALRFEMFAITVLMNMKAFSDQKGKGQGVPETKPGAIWNLAGAPEMKADVLKLESQFKYNDTLKNHLGALTSVLFEHAGVVQITPETVSKIGNLSGVALKLLYASMVSKVNNKNTIWKPKLSEIYRDSLKMRSVYESYQYPEDVDIEIILQEPTPMNEKEQVEIATMKLAAGLTSIKKTMNDMGVENAEELIADILAEKKEQENNFNDLYGVERDQDIKE